MSINFRNVMVVNINAEIQEAYQCKDCNIIYLFNKKEINEFKHRCPTSLNGYTYVNPQSLTDGGTRASKPRRE